MSRCCRVYFEVEEFEFCLSADGEEGRRGAERSELELEDGGDGVGERGGEGVEKGHAARKERIGSTRYFFGVLFLRGESSPSHSRPSSRLVASAPGCEG